MTKRTAPYCRFSAQKAPYIDYKNVRVLRRYVQSTGKIQPRKYSGLSAHFQRQLSTAIKRARMMGLIPFVR